MLRRDDPLELRDESYRCGHKVRFLWPVTTHHNFFDDIWNVQCPDCAKKAPCPPSHRMRIDCDFERDEAHENGDEDFDRDERRGWGYDPDEDPRRAEFQEWVDSLTGGKE